jgi:hypothetical protein
LHDQANLTPDVIVCEPAAVRGPSGLLNERGLLEMAEVLHGRVRGSLARGGSRWFMALTARCCWRRCPR